MCQSTHKQIKVLLLCWLGAGWLVSGIGSHTCYLHLFGNVMHINKVIVVTRKVAAATFLRQQIELRPDFPIFTEAWLWPWPMVIPTLFWLFLSFDATWQPVPIYHRSMSNRGPSFKRCPLLSLCFCLKSPAQCNAQAQYRTIQHV